jgi:hypothetical protein
MKKFLIQILVFSLTFFLLEKVFYVFLYVSPTLEKDKRLEYVLDGHLNKDIIILGSSRGARNVIANQIQDSLNISSYNLSYPGSDIEFHEFLLRSLIEYNNKPKVVLLVVDNPYELLPSESIKFRLDRLYPLAKYNYVNNEMIKRGEKSFLSNFLILSRINKMNFDIREKHISSLDTLKDCGSMPISFQRENREFVFKNENPRYDLDDELPVKLMAFNKFQDLCISNNIKLFIVYPPNFKKHNILFENRIKKLSYPKVSSIIYDTTNPVFKDKDYYYDEAHLKTNGAIIFTNDIIRQLKNKVRPHNNVYKK